MTRMIMAMRMRLHSLRTGLLAATLLLMVAPAQADSTLLGLWRFEGGLNDLSGNAFHGTYGNVTGVGSFSPAGTPSFSFDTPGPNTQSTQSLDLSINNGALQPFAVNVGTSPVLNPSDTLSLAAWFKTGPTTGAQAFISRGDGNTNNRAYSAHVNSHSGASLATNWTRNDLSNANLNTDNDIPGNPDPDFDDNQWHHVVVTLDSISNGGDGRLRMIIDGGAFIGTSPASEDINSIHQVNLPTLIGAFGDGGLPNETLLDDVALFRGVLTPEEINTILAGDFDAFLPPEVPEPGSVLLWSACAAGACFWRWRRRKRNG